MESNVRGQLKAVRERRGVAASDLAKQTGVSRQTIYAIESGTYVPNTEVALRLARALSVTVEDLFSLPDARGPAGESVTADLLSETPAAPGQAVRVRHTGGKRVAIPVHPAPYFLPEADAVITRAAGARVHVEALPDENARTLVLAGCDPAIGLVTAMAAGAGVEIVPAAASSKLALRWLREGKVHIAGSHLEDPASGEFNLPYLRTEFPREDFAVVSFAAWEEGFVVAPGNPKGIRRVEDLARRSTRFINREPGSGSRALLDRLVQQAGIPSERINGYGRTGHGHLAVAHAVASGDADCCVATRSAARAFLLDFVPLRAERYDFVTRRETLSTTTAASFFDILQRTALRRKLESLAGYDTARTGAVLA